MKRFTFLGLTSLTIVAAASCGASVNQEVTYGLRNWLSNVPGLGQLDPVTAISETPEVGTGQEIYLGGRVEQSLPLLQQGLYQLVDESGAIWVLSAISPPAIGESLVVRAVVHYEPILMAGQDIGEYYVEELSRHPQNQP
jgi:hypothetical protein